MTCPEVFFLIPPGRDKILILISAEWNGAGFVASKRLFAYDIHDMKRRVELNGSENCIRE